MSANDKPETIFSAAELASEDVARLIAELEWTHDWVWISKTQECRRATLRGVPAKRVDVIVDRRICDGTVDSRDLLTVAVVAKAGRFDGAIRPRIHLGVRRGQHNAADPVPAADLIVMATPAAISVHIRVGGDGWSGPEWAGSWVRLRSDMDVYNPARVVMWHWRRYYPHLPEADATAAADAWALEMAERLAPPTLAEANRGASRVLYRLSRSLGWRKLTSRERARLGLDCGQWVRDEKYSAAQADLARRRPDVSDATLAFASGRPDVASQYLSRPWRASRPRG